MRDNHGIQKQFLQPLSLINLKLARLNFTLFTVYFCMFLKIKL
uniref:Uncharacterized protein n=1 Tax=Anguilla anguilla TaxID=7936 RepID=A0A0E9Q3V3_ANGAN